MSEIVVSAVSKTWGGVGGVNRISFKADAGTLLVLVRGDDQLNETKLLARTGAVQARPATPEECVATLGAKPGSLGAVANVPAEVKVLADERLRGANDAQLTRSFQGRRCAQPRHGARC